MDGITGSNGQTYMVGGRGKGEQVNDFEKKLIFPFSLQRAKIKSY